MSIEKSLYAAPDGIESLMPDTEEGSGIEIEIVDPEEVTINMGGMEITIDGSEEDDFNANLAEFIGEDVLQTVSVKTTSVGADIIGRAVGVQQVCA